MENLLRLIIIFVWCMFFGFFSVMGYLDETMTPERKTIILVGLLLVLIAYVAFEWLTRSQESGIAGNIKLANPEEEQPTPKDPRSQLDERVLRRLHLYTKDHEAELQAAIAPDPPPTRKKATVSTKKP
ncbi:MAG: hypothetical protein O2999_02085 [Nitrospirae bacterium]|nr:hypothetical protein [Nitrospirota bacterium]MDA1303087.1 hypothetical protein [Nitrospirota bacterium]